MLKVAALSAMLSLAVSLSPALAGVSDAAEPVSAARRADLQALLTQDCGSCHGLTRKGGLGSPLTPEALAGRSDADLAHTIREGVSGTPMPPWKPLLTEADIDVLVDLMRRGDQQ